MKSSAFMALLTAGVAVHATLAKLWVRTALLWGCLGVHDFLGGGAVVVCVCF